MLYGYIRHAPFLKTPIKQLAGMQFDQTFTDFAETQDAFSELEKMLSLLSEGDVVFVKSLDRIGRNATEIAKIAHTFINAGAALMVVDTGVRICRENGEALTVLSMLANLEKATAANVKQEVKSGPKPLLTGLQAAEIRRRADAGEMVTKLAREFGVSRASLYEKYGVKRSKTANK